MQVKKQQLELDMEEESGSKMGKNNVKAVYCHPAYLTCIQITSCKMPDWMKHKLESRLLKGISITSDMQSSTLMADSEEELKTFLMKVKEESEKNWFKTQQFKNKIKVKTKQNKQTNKRKTTHWFRECLQKAANLFPEGREKLTESSFSG